MIGPFFFYLLKKFLMSKCIQKKTENYHAFVSKQAMKIVHSYYKHVTVKSPECA